MENNHDQRVNAPDTDAEDPKKRMNSETSKFFAFIRKNPVLITIFISLVALVIVYLWKDVQGTGAKDAVIKAATEQYEVMQQEMLQLLAKPLVWSIRTEMLRGNMEQVDILITDLVREKNFRYIHLIGPDGIVLLSTNKRYEGQPAGDETDPDLFTVESPVVRKIPDNFFVAAAPVMGIDRRLATLVFSYQPEVFKP
jgi:hypothetical protein